MKKILLATIIGVTLGLVFFINKTDSQSIPPKEQSVSPPPPSPLENVKEEIVIENPERIRIPTLGVDAFIEHVGLDSKDRMDVPKSYQNAAWYNLGYAPGEIGSAVIAGHFDTPQGTPGIFYDLSRLTVGDTIIIQGGGKNLSYSVVDSQAYSFDQIPLEKVFNSQDKKRLNLITCDGVFDRSSQNYSNRLVVYAALKE